MMGIYNGWIRYMTDAWWLGIEAQTVVQLRLSRLAVGNAAAMDEAHLMVSEKILAAAQAQTKATTAILSGEGHTAPGAVLAHYRRKVRANRRRLSR